MKGSFFTNRMNIVYRFTSVLLVIGALFFMFEAVIHAFGLPILEHDKIFLYTHDRYIAIFVALLAAIMILVACSMYRYRPLFFILMGSLVLVMANAELISRLGGYGVVFPAATTIDGQLSILGMVFLGWYLATWVAFFVESKKERENTKAACVCCSCVIE